MPEKGPLPTPGPPVYAVKDGVRVLYAKIGTHPAEWVHLVSRGAVRVGARVRFRRRGGTTRRGRPIWGGHEEGIVDELRDLGGYWPLVFLERI
ncbi:MAG: hypothetical protein ACREN5_05750 [Gemmatimonadales bacterium]